MNGDYAPDLRQWTRPPFLDTRTVKEDWFWHRIATEGYIPCGEYFNPEMEYWDWPGPCLLKRGHQQHGVLAHLSDMNGYKRGRVSWYRDDEPEVIMDAIANIGLW